MRRRSSQGLMELLCCQYPCAIENFYAGCGRLGAMFLVRSHSGQHRMAFLRELERENLDSSSCLRIAQRRRCEVMTLWIFISTAPSNRR